MANKYEYIDTTGAAQTVEANDPTSALSMASNRASNSGVRFLNEVDNTPIGEALDTSSTPSPYQAPSLSSANKPYKDIDEDRVRRDVLQQYQGEIDATKNAYSQLLSETKRTGQGRLGEGVAQQARGGLLGSDFGQAQTDVTRGLNRREEQDVLSSQASAIAAIKARANADARNDIAAKRAAKQFGYGAYQTYQAEEATRKENNLKKLAVSFLRQSIDPQTLGNELKDLAKSYKVSEADIINSYLNTKYEEDQISPKDKYQTVGSGSALVDPKTGEIIYQSPKGEDGLTDYQKFQATQSIAKDTQKRTENAREMKRQANLIESSYNNIVQGGDRSLNTQAIVTSFNKILDPSSVVRESEYDRTSEGQSLLAQLEGKVQQIATGGAGITDATIKEAAEIAKMYLSQSQASINQENQRARNMADQFGLNADFVTTGGYETGTMFEEEW